MLFKGSYEDIIYIVIGILWIAYSIYKGTQKSRAKNPKKRPMNMEKKAEKKSVFETFFDDILAEEKPAPFVPYQDNPIPEEPAEVEETPVAEQEQETVFSYDDYYEEGNLGEEMNVHDNDSGNSAFAETEFKVKDTVKNKERKKPRFDLRKAVVYSEILNKRYF